MVVSPVSLDGSDPGSIDGSVLVSSLGSEEGSSVCSRPESLVLTVPVVSPTWQPTVTKIGNHTILCLRFINSPDCILR